MVRRADKESLAVDVYAQLRTDIFDRRFALGERLKPMELGERFGVSVSVMREALGLLAANKLVHIERNRGFHVTTLSAAELIGLTAARKINEGAALRLSIERGGDAWRAEVVAAHDLLGSLSLYLPGEPRRRNHAWIAAHVGFHHKLIDACGNSVLVDICARLCDATELYRAWSGANAELKRDIAGEHRGLLEAALARDADLAVERLEAHVDRTATILLDAAAGAGPRPQ